MIDREPVLTTTPSPSFSEANRHPTIVVPVEVAFGSGTPLACSAALRLWLEKSKPGIFDFSVSYVVDARKMGRSSCLLVVI